jgi:hypothetical protein
MRIISIEYPGYKRPSDHSTTSRQRFHEKQVDIFRRCHLTIRSFPEIIIAGKKGVISRANSLTEVR